MKIKKLLFWLHLILGCSAAIFIFLMSITGAALTYERQMIQSAERADYPVATAVSQPLAMEKLVQLAQALPAKKTPELVLSNEIGAPVIVKEGRKTLAYLNPFTGEVMPTPGAETKVFFQKLRAFHRWLTLDGKFSETGRWVNGVANVFFIILALSGIYIWLPNRFKKRAFKQKLTLTKKHVNTAARNYQWHNVFGIYMVPILLVVSVTAIFFSFKWPGETLKQYASTTSAPFIKATSLTNTDSRLLLSDQQLIDKLVQQYPQWQSISFSLSNHATDIKIFKLDQGNGGEPQKRLSLALDTRSGEIVKKQSFEQLSSYQKIRSYIRFLHTGEIYGLLGQTLAGLASLLACLLVYTGVMLSWRRWQNSRVAKAVHLEKLAS